MFATEPALILILLPASEFIDTSPSNNAITLVPSDFTSDTHSVPLIDATAFGDLSLIFTGILLVFDQILPSFRLIVWFCFGFFSKNKVEFLVTFVCVLSGRTKTTEPSLPVFIHVLFSIFWALVTVFQLFISGDISTLPVILIREIFSSENETELIKLKINTAIIINEVLIHLNI